MVITLAEAKTLLQISGSTYDSLINMLIPIIEDNICEYCNNHFIDTYQSLTSIAPTVYTYGNDISFENSDNSINSTVVDFVDAGFKANNTIRIYNSLHNDGILTIDSVAVNKVIINSINTIEDEDAGNTFVIARMKFPKNIKITASQMIKFNMEKKGISFKSEKLNDYSYTRSDKSHINGYPGEIMEGLNDFRSLYLKTIPFNLIYERVN